MFTSGASNRTPEWPERGSEVALEQVISGDGLDRAVDVTESDDPEQKTDHGIAVPPSPVQIALRTCLAHKEHDGRAAVERGNRQKIERAEKQVEREESAEDTARKVRVSRASILVQPALGPAQPQCHGRDKHERVAPGRT